MAGMGESNPALRIASWAVCLLALAIGLFSAVLPAMLGVESLRIGEESGLLGWVIASSILGLILVLRAGAVRMGGLMLVIGLGGAMASLGAAVPLGPDDLAWLPLYPISGVGWVTFLGLTIAGLPLLFPTGTPPSRRWRPVLWLLLGALALAAFMSAFSEDVWLFCSDVHPGEIACSAWEASDEPVAVDNCEPVAGPLGEGTQCRVYVDNPIGISGVPELEDSLLGNIGYAGMLVTAALAVVSLGVRLRNADRQERQQIKLVFFVLGSLLAFTLVEALLVEVFDTALPGYWIVELVMWLAIPVSIFLAINRFRLYEIDRLVSRTVSYALVVGVLLGTVAAVAAVVGTRFNEPLVVAGITLAVAALFNPLRRRVQVVVDRRFNRSQFHAERVMADFSTSLRDRVDTDSILDGWQAVVTDTMQPATLSVWVRS
jgi:hypothetical protein